ncbi:helix-turn-helix domain-containing protein [Actinomadura sp. NBRC 104425]|uniref:helix-turn-helix domain-containing protein n=1 Tax=Actinomadura sp. NBRC 104425 TaxID=3032204 RepID=UPI00255682BC|nr:helix-turn-helix domain-containing protein [Actinomadura sp. NBRC 104425]
MPGADAAAQAWARITVPYIAQRPVMRRSPDGGVTFPRSSSKGYRYEVAIQARLPNRPTTVPTFDVHTGTGRLLVLDLDAGRVPAEAAADRAGHVGAVADRAVALIEECGGRALVDRSPSGGAHVYVLWSAPRPFHELRTLARALALRFAPVVDTSPMENSDGQIRGPGAPHKSMGGRLTGFMTLTCSVEEAEAICSRPCGPRVWEGLHVELAAELAELAGGRTVVASHPDAPQAPLDANGEPYRLRRGGRTAIRADLEETARTGVFDRARYVSSSEARQAVLSSAAARGWRLEQVRARLAPGGEWAAISGWWRDDALLTAEWTKAVAFAMPLSDAPAKTPAARELGDSVRGRNTRGIKITPPGPQRVLGQPHSLTTCTRRPQPSRTAEKHRTRGLYFVKPGGWGGTEVRSPVPWQAREYQRIRTWWQAVRIVERLLELEWAGKALTYRAILRAIGAAAQMSGSTVVEFGTRQLAYMAGGIDHTTVARALQQLRQGPYALIDLVQDARGTRADVYQLVVPDAVAADAAWRSWRAGRIEALHPCFRVLGLPAAFAYEALAGGEVTASELSTAALLPRSTAYDALRTLAEHGLAERTADGRWRRGDADLDAVAAATGADDLAAAQLDGHRRDRREWYAFLGIVRDVQRAAGNGAHRPVAAADGGRRRPGRRRPGGGMRRLAPRWLVPPPRTRPVTEADLPRPEEADTEFTVLRRQYAAAGALSQRPLVPPDVAAAIRDDLAVIAADEDHLHAERHAYEAELQALREARDDRRGRSWSGSRGSSAS